MSERSPTLAHVIRASIDNAVAGLRVAVPGRIVSFDSTTQTATIQVLLTEIYEDRDGELENESVPLLPDIPVLIYGTIDFSIQIPIKPNDPGLLIFSDRSLDNWQSKGGEQDPQDLRRHDITDAIFIPGLRALPEKLTEYDQIGMQIGKINAPRIRLTDTEILLGVNHADTSTEKSVLGTTYRQKEDQWFQDLTSQLGQCATALGAAATALTAAATAGALCTAGGAGIGPPLKEAQTALSNAATALNGIAAKLSTFTSSGSSYLSDIVKVK